VQGAGSYDIHRAESSKRFDSIADAHRGDRGYVAVSDTQAEAHVENGGSSLTVNLSGFELDAAGYCTAALDLVDARLVRPPARRGVTIGLDHARPGLGSRRM
jgi:hypothetical protein